jgi:serine/threonine protein kinase
MITSALLCQTIVRTFQILFLDLKSFDVKLYYMKQLVSILAYFRTLNYVHRDVKPANLLLNERWQLILADFGTTIQINKPTELKSQTKKSQEFDNSEDEGRVGTLEYISPEALQAKRELISFSSDLWSFGVIVW